MKPADTEYAARLAARARKDKTVQAVLPMVIRSYSLLVAELAKKAYDIADAVEDERTKRIEQWRL